ncbi:2-amino-4-oxopentanoate thiolase subunit OrtA [Clostridium sp.]|jgi:hypothetical protein|uniref:2-amino-4-oxopentanoate thiolase subunit OrtA n=1 Tax=Clostridium sp. TaxID=1506 RepID=UPI003EF00788
MIAKKGDWVQINNIVLKSEQRTAKIPEETRKVPLELWVKGFLNEDAKIGDIVSITTVTGRMDTGILEEINPKFTYGFGEEFVPELLQIDIQLKNILQEGDN